MTDVPAGEVLSELVKKWEVSPGVKPWAIGGGGQLQSCVCVVLEVKFLLKLRM